MTAEESLPQQPDEANLLQGVPRLNGAADFALWQYRLKLALETLDATYWNVLLANSVPHEGIIEPIPPRAEIIQYMSEIMGITPGTVPREEVDRYIDKHFLKPNAEVKIWLAKDNKVRSVTLEDHVRDRVAHTKHAFEAYNILKNLYRAIAPNIISKWTTWVNCVFEEDAHPEPFVHGWDAALKDLLDTFGQDAVSVRVQICQFISAVTRSVTICTPGSAIFAWTSTLPTLLIVSVTTLSWTKVSVSIPITLVASKLDYIARAPPSICMGLPSRWRE